MLITDAQFWKYEKVTGKLENKACNWIHADLSWDVPDEGAEGFVEAFFDFFTDILASNFPVRIPFREADGIQISRMHTQYHKIS